MLSVQEIAGKPLHFNKLDEFQAWLSQESSSFEWLSQQREPFSRHVWGHVSKQLAIPQSQIPAIQQNPMEIPLLMEI